ncbi:MAG: nitrate reductase alpha subunit [Oceanicoccus sp.]|jgi:nitrate reductase alpha subunit
MIYTGYAACKWLHGDMLQRTMMMLLALTGSTGVVGGGLQFSNAPKTRGLLSFAFADVGPGLRIVSGTTWDYDQGNMKEMTARNYGQELADDYDEKYQHSVDEGWFPEFGRKPWKMGFFAGNNGANWRASGDQWRESAFGKLETIVSLTPDASMTSHYADYVLPIAHHYERVDIVMQARTPYVQIVDEAVKPLGESVDDWEAFNRLSIAIQRRAIERGIAAFSDNVDGRTVRRDFTRTHDLYTMNGQVTSTKDIVQYLINTTPGIPKMSYEEFAAKGIVRLEGSDGPAWNDEASPYHSEIYDSVNKKIPYETLTGRQQFYFDHEWFLEYDEALPAHRDPLMLKGYPLQFMMGHARHGIHSTWRDDSLMISLQRGEPDIYLNPDDCKARGVEDGDLVRIFNAEGDFYAMAHISSGIQPNMVFMYHGWDPMMFKDRKNFSSVITTAGLIKPTSMAGDWGHLGYRALEFAPNQTYKDFSVDFELDEKRHYAFKKAAQDIVTEDSSNGKAKI